MKFGESLFLRYRFDLSKGISLGFKKEDGKYIYSFDLHNNEFLCQVIVLNNGKTYTKIIEKEFNDEFVGINVDGFEGTFVNEIKEEFQKALLDIRDKCFHKVLFVYDQANRITKLIKNTYGEDPDFPFKDLDGYGVFRYPKNRKWYGLIMNIKRKQLLKQDVDGNIEIINLKINKEEKEMLLTIKGIYPCYHMNKASWISVALDDSLSDEEVMKLIDDSRNLVINKKK